MKEQPTYNFISDIHLLVVLFQRIAVTAIDLSDCQFSKLGLEGTRGWGRGAYRHWDS
jgi:hypothetical protein